MERGDDGDMVASWRTIWFLVDVALGVSEVKIKNKNKNNIYINILRTCWFWYRAVSSFDSEHHVAITHIFEKLVSMLLKAVSSDSER